MISSLDCFHPSAKSHALTATALWNSMLTPPQERSSNVPSLTLQPLCAHEDSVFYPGYRLEEGEEEEVDFEEEEAMSKSFLRVA